MSALTKENKVEISFKHPKRKGQFVLRKYKKADGTYFQLKDQNKEPSVYTLRDTVVLNLSNEYDRQIYEGYVNHPIYADMLKFRNFVDEANNTINKAALKAKAFDIIHNLGNRKQSFGRALMLSVNNKSPLEVHAILVEEADRNADPKQADPRFHKAGYERIIELYEDPLIVKRLLLVDGKAMNVFKEKNGIWYWNDTVIGNNMEQAMSWLEKNPDIMEGLQRTIDTMLENRK